MLARLIRQRASHGPPMAESKAQWEGTNLDSILASCSDDLASVELESRDWILVLEHVGNGSCTKIPDLHSRDRVPIQQARRHQQAGTERSRRTRMVLSSEPEMMCISSN